MTREEAIQVLKSTSINLGRIGGKTAYVEALQMAIEALKAQEVKKSNQELKKSNQELKNQSALITIDKQAAIDALRDEFKRTPTTAIRAMDVIGRLPPAQPEETTVSIGRSRGGVTLWYECDACGEPLDKKDRFCRNCGRRIKWDGSD